MAFTKSSELQAADKAVSDWQTKKPGDYVSNYKSQIDDLLNKITNREKFAYNFGTDPIYNQYKNQYTEAGKKAAEDIQAQSAALSGGFGNSYGATAASQQYQNYLGKLNNIIPDLQNNAFNKYQAEGTELQNKLASLQNAEQSDYAKYQNNVNDYYNQLNALTNYANNLYNREYAQYQAAQAAAASRSSGSSGSGKTSNTGYTMNDLIEDTKQMALKVTGGKMTTGVVWDMIHAVEDQYGEGNITKSEANQYLNGLSNQMREVGYNPNFSYSIK